MGATRRLSSAFPIIVEIVEGTIDGTSNQATCYCAKSAKVELCQLTIFVRENSGANRAGPHPQGGGEL